MKLFKLVVPILAGIAMAVGTLTAFARQGGWTAPAVPPSLTAFETDRAAPTGGELASGAENMHADSAGRLWISQDSEGSAYIRVFDPGTHAYTDYTGLTSPNDAQLGPDGNVWWAIDAGDAPTAALARMDPVTGEVLTWTVPVSYLTSLTFAGSKVWALDSGSPTLSSFDPNSHQLCGLHVPDGNVSWFLTAQDGALWMGLATADQNGDPLTAGGLARVTPTDNGYTFWPFGATGTFATPTRISFEPNGVIWFSDEVSDTIGRLETGANRVTLFTPPSGYSPQDVNLFLGKVWFTGQTDFSGAIGYLDPATASPLGGTPVVVTPSHTTLTTSCSDAGAGHLFTAGISTGVSILSPMPLTTTVDAQGAAFVAPAGSQPAGLVRLRSNLWLTDPGRNKLIEVIIPTKDLYLPFVNK